MRTAACHASCWVIEVWSSSVMAAAAQAEVLWLMHAKHRWLTGDLSGARGIMEEVPGSAAPCHLCCLCHAAPALHQGRDAVAAAAASWHREKTEQSCTCCLY